MAVKILTVAEAEKTEQVAKTFDEIYLSIKGKAIDNYICDNSGETINKGDECVVAVLLPKDKMDLVTSQALLMQGYVE